MLAKLHPELRAIAPAGQGVERVLRLRELQETLVSLTILSKKYKVRGECLG